MRAAQISGCSKTRENTQNRVQRFYIHTNLIKFVIAHFKLENRSMSCTFQLICIASLLAFSTFILVFMQNCRDCRFSNSEMTPMLPLNTRYRKRTTSTTSTPGRRRSTLGRRVRRRRRTRPRGVGPSGTPPNVRSQSTDANKVDADDARRKRERQGWWC